MYCGDGINDLAALASAEAGMAVGAGHASAAACAADSHPSIQGTYRNSMPCLPYHKLVSFTYSFKIKKQKGKTGRHQNKRKISNIARGKHMCF